MFYDKKHSSSKLEVSGLIHNPHSLKRKRICICYQEQQFFSKEVQTDIIKMKTSREKSLFRFLTFETITVFSLRINLFLQQALKLSFAFASDYQE